jgi:hypothetical protein
VTLCDTALCIFDGHLKDGRRHGMDTYLFFLKTVHYKDEKKGNTIFVIGISMHTLHMYHQSCIYYVVLCNCTGHILIYWTNVYKMKICNNLNYFFTISTTLSFSKLFMISTRKKGARGLQFSLVSPIAHSIRWCCVIV